MSETIERMEGIEEKKTTLVYIADEELGWVPAKLVDNTAIISNHANASTIIDSGHDNEEEDESSFNHDDDPSISTTVTTRMANRSILNVSQDGGDGASQEMLLQCVDEDSNLIICPDMRDLPYLHEASILYNLKYRYEGISSSSSSLPLSKESSS